MEPFISIRLGSDQQKDYLNFQKYLKMFKENKGCCDEIWFSTSYGYPKRKNHKKIAEKLKKEANDLRQIGIMVSIQLSNSIGHGSTNSFLDYSGMEWDAMIGHDGTVSKYCACPRDKRFLEYIYDITTIYSIIKPTYIWIDDDLRMDNHKPAVYGCFCNRCIGKFNKIYNSNFSREELVDKINNEPKWRMRFIEFNQLGIIKIVEQVINALKDTSPETRIGIQMASFATTTYNGDDYRPLFEKIEMLSGKPVAIRPGGGFYYDHNPRDMFIKAISMGSNWRNVPSSVKIMKAEIENTPHSFAGKSIYGMLIESAIDIAYGCTSLSYSAFMRQNENHGFYNKLLNGLSSWRTFLKGYAETNEQTFIGGGGIVFSNTHNKTNKMDETLFSWSGFKGRDIYESVFYGIPLGWNFGHSNALLLHHSEVDALSDEQLRDIFSKGVITDGLTVRKLNDRGLNNILNIETKLINNVNNCDMCSKHPINGKYAKKTWHNYFTSNMIHTPMFLYPKNKEAQVIGKYVNISDKTTITGISSIIQETSLGGRVAIFTYDPWSKLINESYRYQLLETLDWVSGGMVVRLDTCAQVAVIPRVNKQGQLVSVMLVNTSIEDSSQLELTIRGPIGDNFEWIQPEKEIINIYGKVFNDEIKLEIPSLRGWALGYIKIK